MENIKLRAWDHFNQHMVYSSEDDAVFILHENKWKIKYTREKTLQNGDVEIDVPVWEESEDVEVMLDIELISRNKKNIYVGDIMALDIDGAKWVIEYQSGEFYGKPLKSNMGVYQYELHNRNYLQFDLIGNIHQHPNLLK